jgi:Cu/Ag efflux pump CusA
MLNALVKSSLHFRVLVLALAAVLLVVGAQTLKKTPLDVFPEFAPPLVEIQTEAPGLSTEEVESLITVPLENALNGTAYVTTIRSKSVLGLSSVVLLFERGTDLPTARQLVQERVATISSRLPSVAHPPHILPPLSSTSRAMKIGVWSDTLTQMEMTDLALWTIRPRLMSISGVANVAIWGQRDRQFQVLVDPDRLRANGVTLDQVVLAAGDAATVSAGGFIDTPNQRLPVKHANAITTPGELADTLVTTIGGAPIRIGDVAEVVVGHPPPISDAVINDRQGLLLIVEKQPRGNTLDVSLEVEKAMELLRPGLTILASLFVALTVTPAMSLILLPGAKERTRDAPLVRFLKAIYRRILPAFVAVPRLALFLILATFAITGFAVTKSGEEFGVGLVMRGAEERLSPILMTALCASLALLPLIFRGNLPGHEIEYPMAVVIVGGVATSTILNLFLMPALFGWLGQKQTKVIPR